MTDVVDFKQRFYHSSWARYDLAVPDTLRLVPEQSHERMLAADYTAMQQMIFGHRPEWDEIIETLSDFEAELHRQTEIR